jgi:hypothetical protein
MNSTVQVSDPSARRIFDWRSEFGARTLHEHAMMPAHRGIYGDATPPMPGLALEPPAYAEVNHGRWIAKCPFGCGGAEMVDFDRPSFFCCGCRNTPTFNRPVIVVVPENREAIEAVLLKRPEHPNRNWRPGETLDDLIAENEAHAQEITAGPRPVAKGSSALAWAASQHTSDLKAGD